MRKLIKQYWYGFFMKYHGNKALKIAEVCNRKNAAVNYHYSMSDYYHKKTRS